MASGSYFIAILDAISGVVGRKATFRLETKIRFSQMRRTYKTQSGKMELPIRKLVMVERDYLTITINEEDFTAKSLHQKMEWLTRIIFEKLLYDESRKNDKAYNFNFNHFCGKCIERAEVNYERYSRVLNIIEKNEDKEDLLSSLGW